MTGWRVLFPHLGRQVEVHRGRGASDEGVHFAPGGWLGFAFRVALVWKIALGSVSPAYAQSAADKATARELAAQGIKSLQAGDAEQAVSNLEKAQALYDAPIHLLYLGRAHTKLGNLVEAAEAYRSLLRSQLGPDAPAVFKQAKIDGATELEELEPRLAKLTIDVQPAVEGLELTLDEKPINTAALSVPRATNPGKHVVRASAPGYLMAEAEVELGEGSEETVSLTLEKGEELASSASGSKRKGPKGGADEDASTQEGFSTGPMGFIVGLRVGGLLPVGQLEGDVSMTDYFQPGVSGRGELGLRFLHHFGIKGYFGLGALSPGGELDRFAREQDKDVVATSSARLTEAGVALLATTDPRILGGFGELGFSFLHRYSWVQSFSARSIECQMKASYPGWAVRGGGGMNIPTGRLLNVVPAVDVSVGGFSKRDVESDCESPVGPDLGVVGADDRFDVSFSKSIHYQIFLGVGLDLHFGDDLFR